MSTAPLVLAIREALRAAADPERAPKMQAYMKSAMPFRGVPMPEVRRLTKAAVKSHPLGDPEAVVRPLWDGAAFREERYAANLLLATRTTAGRLELLPLYEHLATTGAWWDLVDEIAHRVADLHDAYPVQTAAVVRRWSMSQDLWLRRLAIIGQLGRRGRVDTALLTEVIEPNMADTEFFIRKAIGWALREFARVDPDWVRSFVAAREDELSALTKREALKHVR